jgi:hypothetical protein
MPGCRSHSRNKKGEFSAQLNNVQLSEITNFITKKHQIIFKGDRTLLTTPVTVTFDNLPLEQMLKKILMRTDFVFTYDNSGRVTAVTLLQAGKSKQTASPQQNLVNAQDPQTPPGAPPSAIDTSDVITKMNPANNKPDEITSFKIVHNSPPPGNDPADSKSSGPDEITSFKIIPNSPPPENIPKPQVDQTTFPAIEHINIGNSRHALHA